MGQARGIRSERDSMGAIDVDTHALWGAQTQRSLHHFAISTERFPTAFICALIMVKRAAAVVNARLGRLPQPIAEGIRRAADEILAGEHLDQFPLSIWQTGSGTQTNMNANEVLANRASLLLGGPCGSGRLVHANDHVNASQSSNDVIPTALYVSAALGLRRRVLPALTALADALETKQREFADLIKVGRTHLQDATPITLGQEFSAYVSQLRDAGAAIEQSLSGLHAVAIGGTAVGTGLNAPPTFGAEVAHELARMTGEPFATAANRFAALAAHDALVRAHGALRALAATLTKIANDVRWLASGPRAGLGEIALPENEPGSSIMPGKVNPTQCEALLMVCAQVMGNDVAIGIAGAHGNFELNVYKPLLAHAFMQSVRLLGDGMRSFCEHCVVGIVANRDRMRELLERSLMLVTALTPHIGYDHAAQIARSAHAQSITLREAALASGHVSAAQFDAWVDAAGMI